MAVSMVESEAQITQWVTHDFLLPVHSSIIYVLDRFKKFSHCEFFYLLVFSIPIRDDLADFLLDIRF